MKHYINRLYGSQANLARALGVTDRTVRYWIAQRPINMLKHVDTIIRTSNTTQLELVGEVLHHEETLKEQK
jgi:transcriptional antiterminator